MRTVVDGRLLAVQGTGSANYLRNVLNALVKQPRHGQYILLTNTEEPVGLSWSGEGLGYLPCLDGGLGDERWEQLHLPWVLEQARADLFISPTMSLPMLRVCPQVMIVYDLGFERFPQFYAPPAACLPETMGSTFGERGRCRCDSLRICASRAGRPVWPRCQHGAHRARRRW